MGSFVELVGEGAFFLTLAIWWIYNSFPEYIKAVWQGEDYYSKCSYSWPSKPKLPIEAIVKLLFAATGVTWELFASNLTFQDNTNRLVNVDSVQHITVFAIFAFHGAIDLTARLGAPLPRGYDRITAALAFVWYAVYYALDYGENDKSDMESINRTLLVYTMGTITAAFIVEAIRPSWFLVHVVRIYGVAVLGTWLLHVSFLLYSPTPFLGKSPNPDWNHYDSNNAKFLTVVYGFHLCLHLVAITITYLVTACILRLTGKHKCHYLHMAPLHLDDKALILR